MSTDDNANNNTNDDINDDDNTRRTIHDCVGSLAFMPNEPIMYDGNEIQKAFYPFQKKPCKLPIRPLSEATLLTLEFLSLQKPL